MLINQHDCMNKGSLCSHQVLVLFQATPTRHCWWVNWLTQVCTLAASIASDIVWRRKACHLVPSSPLLVSWVNNLGRTQTEAKKNGFCRHHTQTVFCFQLKKTIILNFHFILFITPSFSDNYTRNCWVFIVSGNMRRQRGQQLLPANPEGWQGLLLNPGWFFLNFGSELLE